MSGNPKIKIRWLYSCFCSFSQQGFTMSLTWVTHWGECPLLSDGCVQCPTESKPLSECGWHPVCPHFPLYRNGADRTVPETNWPLRRPSFLPLRTPQPRHSATLPQCNFTFLPLVFFSLLITDPLSFKVPQNLPFSHPRRFRSNLKTHSCSAVQRRVCCVPVGLTIAMAPPAHPKSYPGPQEVHF